MGKRKNKKNAGDKWFSCYRPKNANLVQLAESVYKHDVEAGLLTGDDGKTISFGKWMLIQSVRRINEHVAEQVHLAEQEKAKQEAEQETPEGFDEATENFKEGVVSEESFEADCPELEEETDG